MNRKCDWSVSLILVGVCLWILYLFQSELANYGIYTLVDFRTYEILSLVPFVCGLATLIWLVALLVKSRKTKTFRQNAVLLLGLTVLLCLQIGYGFPYTGKTAVSTVATVTRIDPVAEEIVIDQGGEQATLQCPMTIFQLLAEGEEYLISYQYKTSEPNFKRISLAQLLDK